MKHEKFEVHLYEGLKQESKVQPNGIKKLLIAPFKFISNFLFFIGISLIRFLHATFKPLFTNTKPSLFLEKKWLKENTKYIFTSFCAIIGVFAFLFFLSNGISVAQSNAEKLLSHTNDAINHLNVARVAFDNKDFETAQTEIADATENFKQSQDDLLNNGLLVSAFIKFTPPGHDALRLLKGSEYLGEAGKKWLECYQYGTDLHLSPQGLSIRDETKAGINPIAVIHECVAEAYKITLKGSSMVTDVNTSLIPGEKKQQIEKIKSALQSAMPGLKNLVEALDIASNLSSGEKDLILLFQNTDEARPTGGFPGTFGTMKISNGGIDELKVSSVYDLDGQLTENIRPPYPIFAVNNRWFLRDSNWWPNFPDSAKTMMEFYVQESGNKTPDGVVAITPEIVIDLLKLTGPVYLSGYDVTFTNENFLKMAQFESSENFDKELNLPKQILADFIPALIQKLSEFKTDQLIEVGKLIQLNLTEKEILLYANDPLVQDKITAFNWGGKIYDTEKDYLSVNFANLGGTKTDTKLERNYKLTTTINPDGSINNRLEINVDNPLDKIPKNYNKSFVRVYVPKNSRLISVTGFDKINLPQIPIGSAVTNSFTRSWEDSITTDTNSGTITATESNKTVFGNWLEIEGGQNKTVILEYAIPYTLDGENSSYNLIVQKQTGIKSTLKQSIIFPGRKLLLNSNQGRLENEYTYVYEGQLTADFSNGLIFSSK